MVSHAKDSVREKVRRLIGGVCDLLAGRGGETAKEAERARAIANCDGDRCGTPECPRVKDDQSPQQGG